MITKYRLMVYAKKSDYGIRPTMIRNIRNKDKKKLGCRVEEPVEIFRKETIESCQVPRVNDEIDLREYLDYDTEGINFVVSRVINNKDIPIVHALESSIYAGSHFLEYDQNFDWAYP